MRRLILTAILATLPVLALADDMDLLIGDWASPDGTLKHRIAPGITRHGYGRH